MIMINQRLNLGGGVFVKPGKYAKLPKEVEKHLDLQFWLDSGLIEGDVKKELTKEQITRAKSLKGSVKNQKMLTKKVINPDNPAGEIMATSSKKTPSVKMPGKNQI